MSVVERWWTRWPDADIGIALTPDLYVLDTDTAAALSAVRGLDLPRTLAVSTARGAHYYLRVPYELRRLTPRAGAGGLHAIEGKGAPGPVTWAGSVHPSGHVYAVIVDAPIANMPRALVEAIGVKRSQRAVGEATPRERALWSERHAAMVAGVRANDEVAHMVCLDARADRMLVLRALRCELPEMPAGWADRFFKAGAFLGPHVAAGALPLDTAIQELTAVFHDLDTDAGDPGHVLRSIERGIATGARESERSL